MKNMSKNYEKNLKLTYGTKIIDVYCVTKIKVQILFTASQTKNEDWNSDPNSLHNFTNKKWGYNSILLLVFRDGFVLFLLEYMKICNTTHTCFFNAAILKKMNKKPKEIQTCCMNDAICFFFQKVGWSSALVHLKVLVHRKFSFPRVQKLNHTAQISVKKQSALQAFI